MAKCLREPMQWRLMLAVTNVMSELKLNFIDDSYSRKQLMWRGLSQVFSVMGKIQKRYSRCG